MKITIVYTTPPYPPDSGGKIVDYTLLRGLAQRGHKLTCLALVDQRSSQAELDRSREALMPLAHFLPIRWRSPRLPLQSLHLFLGTMPATMAKYRCNALHHTIEALIDQGKVDLLLLNMLHMAYLAEGARQKVPTVLLQHNVQSTIARRLVETQKNPILRLLLRREWRSLQRYEGLMCAQVDLCLTLSSVDAEGIRKLNPNVTPRVLPPPIDVEAYPTFRPEQAPPVITLVGGYDWLPNSDGAEWFCERILPKILAQEPGATVQLIGRQPTARMVRYSRSNPAIRVPGHAADLGPYLDRTAVFVTPVRAGSGIRIKILEAMAWGLPVVSTRIGCEGIEAADGRDLIIADSEDDFAAAVVRLLRKPHERRQLGLNGRSWVRRHHDLHGVVDRLEHVLRTLQPFSDRYRTISLTNRVDSESTPVGGDSGRL